MNYADHMMGQTQLEILIHLMSWAMALTGYECPDTMPQIVYADHNHFVEVVCDGVDTERDSCGVRAYYNDEDDARIYLNTKYYEINGEWSPEERGIILHEMVHYLQDMSGKWDGYLEWNDDKLCVERQFRQREAYETQDIYMKRVYGIERKIPRYYDNCGNN